MHVDLAAAQSLRFIHQDLNIHADVPHNEGAAHHVEMSKYTSFSIVIHHLLNWSARASIH